MAQSAFDQVRWLVGELTPEQCLMLFEHLANVVQLHGPIGAKPSEKPDGMTIALDWKDKREGGRAVLFLDGLEVFTVTFNEENYTNVLFEKLKTDQPFAANLMTDAQRDAVFASFREFQVERGESPSTDEELKWFHGALLVDLSNEKVKESLIHSAHQIQHNLGRVAKMIAHKVTHAGVWTSSHRLLDLLELRDKKTSPQEIKETLYGSDWEYLKPILGIASRGGSDPRVEVSDEQCAQLAGEYSVLLTHWQKVKRNRNRELNWRAYAKVDEPDTPDDLLDRLDGGQPHLHTEEEYPNIPSVMALEHAARRSRIPPNEYSSSRLKDLRKRGDAIRGQIKTSD